MAFGQVRGWKIGGGLSAVALVITSASASSERGPVTVATTIDQSSCQSAPDRAGYLLRFDVALGLVAFNSPYLFGGRALHNGLTCGACHNASAPTGAAVRFRFRNKVPDLRRSSDRGVDVASFVDVALVHEFAGRPASRGLTSGLVALAKVIAPTPPSTGPWCQIDAAALVDVTMHLLEAQTGSVTIEASEFLIDSARFDLGEMAREGPADTVLQVAISSANQSLRDLLPIVDSGQTDIALKSIRSLTERWEVALQKRGLQPFSVEEEKKP
jgi:hypothetical protein